MSDREPCVRCNRDCDASELWAGVCPECLEKPAAPPERVVPQDEQLAVRVAREERDAWKLEAEEAREVAQQVKAEVSKDEPPTMSRIASMMGRITR